MRAAQEEKENLGFNAGRRTGKRPSTAVLAWRPETPFLTYEKMPPNAAEKVEFLN